MSQALPDISDIKLIRTDTFFFFSLKMTLFKNWKNNIYKRLTITDYECSKNQKFKVNVSDSSVHRTFL